MERLHIPITGDASNFRSALQSARDGVRQTTKQIEDSGMTIEQVFSRISNAAAMSLAGFSVKEFVQKMVQVRGEFQQLEVAFTTMLGNAEKADALMQQIARTAATTPFDLQGVTNGAKQLLAYGIEADKVNDTLIHLGDIAAGLSLPLTDLVYLYGTTMVQGRMFTQDLRQFQNRGIPIAEELAKVLGVTKDKVGELVTAGKVGAQEFNQAIMAMSSEGGKFAGLMEAQSKTISGQISNIEDAVDMMFNNIGKQSEGIISGTLDVVSDLVENYEKVGKVIASLVAVYGTYKTAVMVYIAIQKAHVSWIALEQTAHLQNVLATEAEIAAKGKATVATVLLDRATKMLNATMLANPYVLVASLIAGIAVALWNMKSQQDLVNEAQEEYNRKKEETIAKEKEHADKLNELISIAGNESLYTDTRREAMLKLKAEYPDLFKKYNTEIEALEDIAYWKAKIAEIESGKSITLAKNELEDVNRQIRDIENALNSRRTGNSGKYEDKYIGTASSVLSAKLTQLRNTRDALNKEQKKASDAAYLKNLTGVSNEELQRQISERRNLIARIEMQEREGKKNIKGRVVQGGVTGLYNKAELQDQLQTMEWEQNRRAQIVKDGSKDFVAEANKAYAEQRTALQQLEALHDPLKRAASNMEIDGKKVKDMGSDEFLAAIEKQQKAVDEAKKKVDAYNKAKNGGSSSTSETNSAAREDASRRQRVFEQELSERQRQAKQTVDMENALSAAAIADEQNRARRELMQAEKDHKDALAAIDRQAEEMRKANYEAAKKAWEAANTDKTKTWADTDMAKDVAANGYKNIALTKEQLATLKAEEDKTNAARVNAEKEVEERLVSQYQSYTDRKLEIDRQYQDDVARINAAIAKAEERGDKQAVEALKRSLAEAAKERAKSQSELSLKQLKETPEYIRAFEDLDNTSTETLQTLISMFEKAKEAAAESMNPEDLREYTQTLQQLYDKVGERDPFAAMKVSAQAMRDAHKEVIAAENRLNAVRSGVSIPTSFKLNKETGEITATYLTEEEAVRLLAAAKDKEAKATNQHRSASQQAQKAINELAAAIQGVGNAMGGTAGEVLGMIGDVMTFATSCMQAITFESQATSAALRAVESASVILAVISAAIQLLQTISKLNKDAHAQYEEYAAKVSEVEQLRQAMYEYRMELIKTKQEENGWFSTTGFQELRDQWVQSSAAMAEYAETAAAAQAVYENESGGGWLTGALSWLGKAVGWIVSIPGQVVSGLLDKLGIVDKNSFLGKAIEWTTDVGFGGAEAFIGKLTGELLNAQNYAEGTVAAIKNLRVETRAASSGFLGTGIGGHSQKTQDLQSFVKEKMGVDLFDANGVLTSVELGKRVMEEYGDKMVGETKKTMERLIELKEQYDEWQDQLREFISELYSPLADDMVDALWEWYENGTNIMDAFKSYSTDTFRSIGKEMVKQLVNTLLFDELKEKMQALLTGYSLDAAAGQKSEEQLTQELMAGTQLQIQNLLNKAKLVAPVLQNAVQTWEEGMESMGLSTEESFENVFSSIKDNFKSMLLDMESDATDFGKQLKKAMYEALLERFVMKAPVTVTIDGEQQTFDSLNSYLDNWQKRANEVAQTMSATEHDTQKSSLEEQIAALEAERKANLEARQQARNRGGLQSQYDSLYNQYGYLLRGGTAKTEEEIKAKERLLAMQEELAKRSAEYDERNTEILAKIRDLRSQLAEIEASETLTDEERAAKIAELNAELEEQLAISKQIAKTYADMAGWTMEMKIDASPLASLGDELLSVLQDTSKGVDDWKKELVEAMTNDLIKEVVYNADFEKSIRDLQEQYVNIMSSDMSAEEKAAAIQKIADAIAALYTTTEEKVDGLKNILPDIDTSPFDGLRDTLLENLTDMEGDVEKFRDNILKTLTKDLIEKLVLDVPLTLDITRKGEDGVLQILEGKGFDNFNAYSEDWNKAYLDGMKELGDALKALNEAEASGNEEAVEAAEERYTAASAYIDKLIEELVALEAMTAEAAEQFKERMRKATQDTTFTDMEDSLVSALMDMDGDINDFANSMKETIVRKLVEAFMVSEQIKGALAEIQSAFNYQMASGADAQTIAEKMGSGFSYTDANGEEKTFGGIDSYFGEEGEFTKMQATIKTFMEAIGFKFKETEELFDSLGDSILDSLMNTESGVEDFMQSITETIVRELTESYMATEDFQDKLADVKKDLQDAVKAVADAEAALAGAEEGSEAWEEAKRQLEEANEQLEAAKQNAKDLYDEAEAGTEAWRAALKKVQDESDTTFKDMTSGWVGSLIDFDATAEDWAKEIGRTMAQRIIEQMIVPTLIQPLLDSLQTAFNAAVKAQEDGSTNWRAVLGADGVQSALQAIKDAYPELKEAVNAILAALDITPEADAAKDAFSGLTDTIINGLTDAEMTAEDFAKNIARTLTTQMMGAILESQYAQQIADIQQLWKDALTTGDTTQIDVVKAKIVELYNAMGKTSEELLGIFKDLEDEVGDTTFTDMADNWTSTLMDMEATAEDWAKNVGQSIAQEIIKKMVMPTMIQPLLNDMQKAWNAAAEQEGATYQTMLDAMMPYLSDLVGAYEELRHIADYILNSLGVYKETVEEIADEVEYALQDMKSNFVSALMDMNGDAEEWSQTISRTLAEAFIKDFVLGDAFDAQMKNWQEHYESILHSGLSEEERASQLKLLRDAIASAKDGYVEQALAIQELLGLNAASSDQTATTNMADKITYEQADQLLGVNMAQEMTLEQILATLRGGALTASGGNQAYLPTNAGAYSIAGSGDTARQIEATLQDLRTLNLPDGDTVREIRGLIIISNSYLYDIKESNAQILRQFGERLDVIWSRLATF